MTTSLEASDGADASFQVTNTYTSVRYQAHTISLCFVKKKSNKTKDISLFIHKTSEKITNLEEGRVKQCSEKSIKNNY